MNVSFRILQFQKAEWEVTMKKYAEYLNTGNELWRSNNRKAYNYMDKHKKRPSEDDTNQEIKKIGQWVSTQKQNYQKNIGIMENPVIRAEWESTLKKYAEYFESGEEAWRSNNRKACDYMDKYKKAPSTHDKNPVIKTLSSWLSTQKKNYSKNVYIMANPVIRNEWEATLNKYAEYFMDFEEAWRSTHRNVCDYMDKNKKAPSTHDKNPEIKKLGSWVTHQKSNYAKNIKSMANPDIRNEWESTMKKYAEYLNQPKLNVKKQTEIPLPSAESTAPHHFSGPSKIALLHLKYHRMRSDNLHAKFKEDPQLWREYHDTRKDTFAKCDPLIQEVDISALPLEDASVEIAIMSLALWGTNENCTQYIKEAYRVLESGGKFYISDSTKKWSPESLSRENGGELLRTLLTTNGFVIRDETIGTPFCLFVCEKL